MSDTFASATILRRPGPATLPFPHAKASQAERILRLVGKHVVMALERLMGLILVAVSVAMRVRSIKPLAHPL